MLGTRRGNGAPYSEALVNLAQQLDAPLRMRLGLRYPLVAHSRSFATESFVPVVALRSRVSVLPGLGTLRLDLSQAIALPWLTVPGSATSARYDIPIPTLAALGGVELWIQAVVLSGAGPVLSNAVREVVIP